MPTLEHQLEEKLIEKLRSLKYEYRPEIRDRATLEQNFRDKFEALNRVCLTEGEFRRLLDEIITPDVFAAARTLRDRNSFILVLKKCKKPEDVLFINAAEHFVKGKRQNQLTEKHIAKIIDTYQFRKEEKRYSKRISMKRIAEEGYNLNISRYISTAISESEIDLTATHGELVEIENTILKTTRKHNKFLKELGLPPLPCAPKG